MPTRRQVLTTGAAGALLSPFASGTGEASLVQAAPVGPAAADSERALRFAHLTDVHIKDDKAALYGFEACLNEVQAMDDPPEMIFFGGDNVMGVDGENGADTAPVQLGVWNRLLEQHCSLPHFSVIGNHDILRMDPDAGKKWAVDSFGLPGRYFHFDRAGWRFIGLDSTSPNVLRGDGGGYKGLLDEEQFAWLSEALDQTPDTTPVCIITHIPILGVTSFFDGNNERTGNWVVPGSWMHIDARRLKDLFKQHPNVKLCLSGHEHLVDEVHYLGVKYACNGAVCGSWWNGNYHEFGPGYAIVDLYRDGSSRIDFKTYPWQPRD